MRKEIADVLGSIHEQDRVTVEIDPEIPHRIGHNREAYEAELEERMHSHAAALEFEEAAQVRDELKALRDNDLGIPSKPGPKSPPRRRRTVRNSGRTRSRHR